MSDAPVIAGTRRGYKELVDGTLRVQVDIAPQDKPKFLALFPEIDTPIAMAPLVLDFERRQRDPWHELGALAQSAVRLCREPAFQRFVVERRGHSSELPTEEGAAAYIREWCKVSSRRELDAADGARERFGALMAEYREWYAEHG